jgi:hypothetical protein
MATWTDAKGRVWSARLTVRALMVFERLTGRRLLEELFRAPAGDVRKSGMEYLGRLFGDIYAAGAFLYSLSQDECRERKVTLEELCDALDGDTLPRAMEVALGALADFFQKAAAGMTLTAATPEEHGP